MHVNLLPKRFRIQLLLRAQLRQWSKLWMLCLLVVLVLIAVRGQQVVQLRSRLAVLQQRTAPIVQKQQQIARLGRQIETLQAQAEATERIQPPDRSLALLGILAHSTRDTDGNIQIVRLTVQAGAAPPAAADRQRRGARPTAAKGPVVAPSSLSIQGIASDDHQLSHFVASLRRFAVFHDVDLRSSSRMSSTSDQGREFQLECRF